MVREYPKRYAKEFLEKAKKFLKIAKQSLNECPEEAAFNAVQATINANDGLTIWALEKRASRDHREAILLHKEAAAKIGESKINILRMEIDARDIAGYDAKKCFSKNECNSLIKKAERFVDWVERIIYK